MLAVVVALLVALPQSSSYAAPGKRMNPTAVTVCHFHGHDGDFVTIASEFFSGGNRVCDNQFGNAITVSESACANGHDAQVLNPNGPRPFTCADGDDQLIDI